MESTRSYFVKVPIKSMHGATSAEVLRERPQRETRPCGVFNEGWKACRVHRVCLQRC